MRRDIDALKIQIICGNIMEQGVLFEENYLARTHKTLTTSPDVALTELVANAWDAGASFVKITIPESCGGILRIQDDGCGMTRQDFETHWMRLSYNRLKHQGKWASMPNGKNHTRLAYGRNGIGRHGLLCFNDEYKIITTKDGIRSVFTITTNSDVPILIISQQSQEVDKMWHETILEVSVDRNRPDPDRILDVLAARFVTDPTFRVYVNGKTLPLDDLIKDAQSGFVNVGNNITLEILFVDTAKSIRKGIYQGIAFWQQNRLVGEPSWILGKKQILDGRTSMAKRYVFIVRTNDLGDFVSSDWSCFRPCDEMIEVYEKVSNYIEGVFAQLNQENISEIKANIKEDYKDSYRELSPLGKFEVDEVIDHITMARPTSSPETIAVAVEAVINLEKTRNGKSLLQKLSQLKSDEVEALDKLLEQWSVKDALTVLDEIDRRLSVIEAISKLSSDSSVDELGTLHPLITSARWVFGPEFDSPEYTSNRQLQTLAKSLFGFEDADFLNEKQRPDLVVKGDTTYCITGTESYDDNEVSAIDKILIIELKRGGFSIGRKERDQAQGYVEDLLNSGCLSGGAKVFAFVVGAKLDRVSGSKVHGDQGIINAITYSKIVDTANRRLFRLREILNDRYAKVSGIDLSIKAHQLALI